MDLKPIRSGESTPAALTLDIKRAAQKIGISVPTLRALLESGALRHVRVGRRVLVPLSSIEELLSGEATTSYKKRRPRTIVSARS